MTQQAFLEGFVAAFAWPHQESRTDCTPPRPHQITPPHPAGFRLRPRVHIAGTRTHAARPRGVPKLDRALRPSFSEVGWVVVWWL